MANDRGATDMELPLEPDRWNDPSSDSLRRRVEVYLTCLRSVWRSGPCLPSTCDSYHHLYHTCCWRRSKSAQAYGTLYSLLQGECVGPFTAPSGRQQRFRLVLDVRQACATPAIPAPVPRAPRAALRYTRDHGGCGHRQRRFRGANYQFLRAAAWSDDFQSCRAASHAYLHRTRHIQCCQRRVAARHTRLRGVGTTNVCEAEDRDRYCIHYRASVSEACFTLSSSNVCSGRAASTIRFWLRFFIIDINGRTTPTTT